MFKCPSCNKPITTANLQTTTVGDFKGVAYTCPSCATVLSIGIDPIATRAVIIETLQEDLRKVANTITDRVTSALHQEVADLKSKIEDIGRKVGA